MLSNKEIKILSTSIDKLNAGVYQLKDMLGDQWHLINSPTSFGKRFKKVVLEGGFKKIKFNEIKTDNHNTYIVSK